MNIYIKVELKNILKRIIGRKYKINVLHLFDHERYYIIRRPSPWAGFFANYLFVVGHIIYAKNHGYMPVVDMENYPTLYCEDAKIDEIKNGWDYFFEQPNGETLKKAYNSSNYILSDSANYLKYLPFFEGDNLFRVFPDKIEWINNYICSLIPIKDSIQKRLDYEVDKLILGKTLGVHVRGTDKRERVVDHHVSATVNAFIKETNEVMLENDIDIIFLCCDEAETINAFKNKFGDKICTTIAFRATANNNQGVHLIQNHNRNNHKYQMGYEVLRDCYLLSKCHYLIHGHSNVTNTALLWNNNQYISTFFVESDLYK